MIPLSPEAYFASLSDYNQEALLAVFAFLMAGAVTILATIWKVEHWFRLTSVVLAAAWLHLGWAYHLGYFAELNFWDYPIGVLCLVQAALLLGLGAVWGKGEQPERMSLGGIVMRLALIGLPLIGWISAPAGESGAPSSALRSSPWSTWSSPQARGPRGSTPPAR